MTDPKPEISALKMFESLLDKDPEKSMGLAAIEALLEVLKTSTASTVQGLTKDLSNAVDEMMRTDRSSATVQSACELFLRFSSLISQEKLIDANFEAVKCEYVKRGNVFIKRIEKSRSIIAKCFRPFIRSNLKVLTHSYSKVVLESLLESKAHGCVFHVFVTESQPDNSGRRMAEKLRQSGIQTTLILDSAVGYIMESIDIVVFGAEGVMETGGIINKIGTLGIAICAKAMNKPVYVMAESIKFIKEYPLNQSDTPNKFKYRYSTLESKKDALDDEHPLTDYTPPQYLNLLITDLGIFTPAAVGDELIKLYT
uniref:Translation initiation factor eIF2B subunit alpha n=1 Tax=Panagrellus redivivus TaxID=6233 RepID=A0A7E4ZX42_PANRE